LWRGWRPPGLGSDTPIALRQGFRGGSRKGPNGPSPGYEEGRESNGDADDLA